MEKGRLEAFSDGVFAIIITITVLTITTPEGASVFDLKEMVPLILVYGVSFLMIGTNWANHHYLLNITSHINGKVIWANHIYLFTLSFFPVTTEWVGKTGFQSIPTIVYVVVNLAESTAFIVLERIIISSCICKNLDLGKLKKAFKEEATIFLELMALLIAFSEHFRILSYMLLIFMALMWVIPDFRMKKVYEIQRKKK
ncbi:TMEM175 family protein [Succinivibrio sp.]|uniref:TMEM175 family protein n=1 Tax=Succinivibrio sp. TaxID=2053619 RepID=UPI0025F481AE|nr:TMEM175 family protein [Succinivibrio sp.]MBQ9219865.1 DUF1211 domain-containing protein [Succinivibrio sp.]